ncbi:MAG: hemin uptake protein HemP [Sulfuritalea sp.]|nr:hemin uptake protein HemP [Sulfuritalea sp.]
MPRGAAGKPHTLDSATLLGAKREVRIVHEGETYRLCRTRQGKLILIK